MEINEASLSSLECPNIENNIIYQNFCNSITSSNTLSTTDSLLISKNIIIKRIGINVLTGNEKWFFDKKTKTYYYYQFNKFHANIGGMYDKMMCTHFRWTSFTENIEYGQFQGGKENQIMFNFDFGKKGVDHFKNWLKEQYNKAPVKVFYIMQYPIIQNIPKSSNPNPHFIPTHTSIISNSEVQPIINTTYKKYFKKRLF